MFNEGGFMQNIQKNTDQLQALQNHVRDNIVRVDDVEIQIAHDIGHIRSAQLHVNDAKQHVHGAQAQMRETLDHMPVLAASKRLPATSQEITRYVEQLLTSDEQKICDMATD
jgi:hypothetical protein